MLKYNKNKKFKIMQITDIQEVPKISPDTKKLLNAVIEQEKPDLVVLTGDQIKGYGASYKVKGRDTVQALKEIDTLKMVKTNSDEKSTEAQLRQLLSNLQDYI